MSTKTRKPAPIPKNVGDMLAHKSRAAQIQRQRFSAVPSAQRAIGHRHRSR